MLPNDAHSPITGRWGMEGFWDVLVLVGVVGLVGLLVLVVGTTKRQRLAGALLLSLVVPGIFAPGWVAYPTIAIPGVDDHADCVMRGTVTYSDPCGEAYLTRYVLTVAPLVLAALFGIGLMFMATRTRLRARRAKGGL